MNIIDQSGVLAVATRLQRLSEQLRTDGFKIYKLYEVDFQPKWFPVIYALYSRNILSVIELSLEIGYSHPSTIALLKELEKEKLVQSGKDKNDERKRLIQLTKKGKGLVSQMQPVWQTITSVLSELIESENNLMKAIEEVEVRLQEKSFLERAKSRI